MEVIDRKKEILEARMNQMCKKLQFPMTIQKEILTCSIFFVDIFLFN